MWVEAGVDAGREAGHDSGWPVGATGGNSLSCRIYRAALSDPATHGPHAGPTGGGVCS